MSDKNLVTVRPAQTLDAVNIVKLLRSAWQEIQNTQGVALSEERALGYVNNMIRDHFVVVAEVSGRVIGSIALQPMQYPWSEQWFMGEMWFFVVHTHRERITTRLLLKEAERLLDAKQMSAIFRSEVPDDQDDFTRILHTREGYRHVGGVYVRMPDLPEASVA
jgi:N-acetylglutamate synthase-like GNAT family acetyltransferase